MHCHVCCVLFAHTSRWDCIEIKDKPVEENRFRRVEEHYQELNIKEGINASPFEILTATAFTLFNQAKVDFGVIEVGMGGKLDATNILNNQVISVITKIARDHENFLGSTLEEIAKHKAGILRPNVPYIINPSNELHVQNVIDEYAREIGAGPRLVGDTPKLREKLYSKKEWSFFATRVMPFQRDNAVLAIVAVKEALKSTNQEIKDEMILDELGKKRVTAPGRLQWMRVEPVFGSQSSLRKAPRKEILIDGAHNPDAAKALNEFVWPARKKWLEVNQRENIKPPKGIWNVTWVLAMTEGKDASQFLKTILRAGDNVITTAFGPVDGMPWVKPMDPKALLKAAQSAQRNITGFAMPETGALRALFAAKHLSAASENHNPIVLTGSLYFVGDFHRELAGQNSFNFWKTSMFEDMRAEAETMDREEYQRVTRFLKGHNMVFNQDGSSDSSGETSFGESRSEDGRLLEGQNRVVNQDGRSDGSRRWSMGQNSRREPLGESLRQESSGESSKESFGQTRSRDDRDAGFNFLEDETSSQTPYENRQDTSPPRASSSQYLESSEPPAKNSLLDISTSGASETLEQKKARLKAELAALDTQLDLLAIEQLQSLNTPEQPPNAPDRFTSPAGQDTKQPFSRNFELLTQRKEHLQKHGVDSPHAESSSPPLRRHFTGEESGVVSRIGTHRDTDSTPPPPPGPARQREREKTYSSRVRNALLAENTGLMTMRPSFLLKKRGESGDREVGGEEKEKEREGRNETSVRKDVIHPRREDGKGGLVRRPSFLVERKGREEE
jgi:folylpolyglutamate synthase/dihydrofolate synthase